MIGKLIERCGIRTDGNNESPAEMDRSLNVSYTGEKSILLRDLARTDYQGLFVKFA